jgi:hypothetical protein
MYVIEHWHPLFEEKHYVTSGSATTNVKEALVFTSEKTAKKWVKEHDSLYGGKLKIKIWG